MKTRILLCYCFLVIKSPFSFSSDSSGLPSSLFELSSNTKGMIEKLEKLKIQFLGGIELELGAKHFSLLLPYFDIYYSSNDFDRSKYSVRLFGEAIVDSYLEIGGKQAYSSLPREIIETLEKDITKAKLKQELHPDTIKNLEDLLEKELLSLSEEVRSKILALNKSEFRGINLVSHIIYARWRNLPDTTRSDLIDFKVLSPFQKAQTLILNNKYPGLLPGPHKNFLEKFNIHSDSGFMEFNHKAPVNNFRELIEDTRRLAFLTESQELLDHPEQVHRFPATLHVHLTPSGIPNTDKLARVINRWIALKVFQHSSPEPFQVHPKSRSSGVIIPKNLYKENMSSVGLIRHNAKGTPNRDEYRRLFTRFEDQILQIFTWYKDYKQDSQTLMLRLSSEIKEMMSEKVIRELLRLQPEFLDHSIEHLSQDQVNFVLNTANSEEKIRMPNIALTKGRQYLADEFSKVLYSNQHLFPPESEAIVSYVARLFGLGVQFGDNVNIVKKLLKFVSTQKSDKLSEIGLYGDFLARTHIGDFLAIAEKHEMVFEDALKQLSEIERRSIQLRVQFGPRYYSLRNILSKLELKAVAETSQKVIAITIETVQQPANLGQPPVSPVSQGRLGLFKFLQECIRKVKKN